MIALFVFAVGCQNDELTVDRIVDVGPNADKTATKCDYWTDGWVDANTDSTDFEWFTGQIDPTSGGGLLVAFPTTWGHNVWFSVAVPDDALPAGSGLTEFTLKILKRDKIDEFRDDCPYTSIPVYMILEPTDTPFDEDITVSGTYMPWICTDLSTVKLDMEKATCVSDGCGSQEYAGTAWQDGNRIRFTFDLSHFSDWEMGTVPRDTIPPGGKGTLPQD
jgi:hypothetical protein